MPITTPICVGVAMGVTKNPPLIQIPGSSPAIPYSCLKLFKFYNYVPTQCERDIDSNTLLATACVCVHTQQ